MGALGDLALRLDRQREALVKRLGGTPQRVPELTLPALLEVMALGQRTRPADAVSAGTVDREHVQAALSSLAERQGIPVTATEAQEVLELLATGELFEDLGTGLAAAVRLGKTAPTALVADALALPALPEDLVSAIRRDLSDDSLVSARDLLVSLRDGRVDRRILTHTLRALFALAAARTLVETLRTLIAPENRTFRLAIAVYARLHGVDIDVEDLDAVYHALDPADPDLGSLFAQGLSRVRERYGQGEEALAFLRRLSATR